MIVQKSIFKVKWYILLQILSSLVATAAIALIPVCNKYLVDVVFQESGKNFLPLLLVYILSYFIFLVMTWISERFVWMSAISFENNLKKECFSKILNFSYKNYSDKKSEEYLSLLTNNITSIEQDHLQPICALIKSLVSIIVYAVIISMSTSPIICISLFVLSIISAFTPQIYKKNLKKAGKAYVDEASVYTKRIADLLEGFELVDDVSRLAFTKQNATFTDMLSKKRYQLGIKKVNGNTISGVAVCLIDTVIFILCGIIMSSGNITVGTVLAAITYSQAFTDPVQEILYDINTLNASKDIVTSLESMLNSSIDREKNQGTSWPFTKISLKDVCVSYPGKQMHYNVQFFVGRKYLIKGQSGRGKTTLLDTIMGHRCATGEILIDDFHKTLSKNDCFYLSQHQHIFSDNSFNNITIFGSYPNLKNHTNTAFPMYDRVCNAVDCTTLSGGEKQILKLFRMLAQQKPILLLDEPFSALDDRHAKEVFHVLSSMSETIILVSHNTNFEEDDLKQWETIFIEDICYEE